MNLGKDGQIYLPKRAGFLTRVTPRQVKVERVAEGLLDA